MPDNSPGGIDPHILLGRRPVAEGLAEFGPKLATRRILVTGAAGSIGSALSTQLAGICPQALLLLDNHENSLAHLRKTIGVSKANYELADVRDEGVMSAVITSFRPEIIIHLAAYKHVDLAESFPERYIAANVLATWKLAQIAAKAGVERLVYPSSDKAVHPCSVYGATKQAVEILLRSQDAVHPSTRFVAIRLVNVMGARGGVFDTIIRQASSGACLTITHPEMTRYWMTEGEAVRLLACAATITQTGQCLALDCGKPVSLLEVAQGLWDRYCPDGQEFTVNYIGIRPGERLAEILLADGEAWSPSEAPGIVQVTGSMPEAVDAAWLEAEFDQWNRLLAAGNREELRERLLSLAATATLAAEKRG